MTRSQIIKLVEERPKEIFYLFRKDNFKLAKKFWGILKIMNPSEFKYAWQYHLSKMLFSKSPVNYLKNWQKGKI